MTKPQLDDVDRRIIELLRVDGRSPNATIARELSVSESSVRRRIGRLTGVGAIRIIAVSPAELYGLTTTVVFSFRLPLNRVAEVVNALVEMEEIAFVYETSGRFNVLAQGFFVDQEAVRDFLAARLGTLEGLDGMGVLETLTILSTRKSGFGLTSRRTGS